MKIIPGERVDLIEPFPTNQLHRLWTWINVRKGSSSSALTTIDGSPHTEEEFVEYMRAALPFTRSFGVIDKNGTLGMKHEAPIIGFTLFEPSPPCSFYAHVASNRRAWGKGLIDEAARLSVDYVFDTEPGCLRISALIIATNKPARKLAERIGFKKDGYFRCVATINAKPISMVHYGLVKDEIENAGSTGKEIESGSQEEGVQGSTSGPLCVRDSEEDRLEAQPSEEAPQETQEVGE